MRPMIDNLELPNVQEIASADRRILKEHKPPGMSGSLLQNMGRKPTVIVLWGIATGSQALSFVENLDGKFRAGNPVPFISDIIEDAEIEKMIIDDLSWQEVAGKPERFVYVVTLKEYIEPVEPENLSILNSDILDDALNIMDDLIDGLDLGLAFQSGLERYLPTLSGFLERVKQFGQSVG
ncbi:MAG: hypothetical protein Kow0042_26180 [Calditrichia bacterium]